MYGDPKEFELKLELARARMADVAASAASNRFSASKPRRQRVLSIYFDTAGHKLRRAGVSLRLRHIDDCWVQTVKLGTGVHGGVSNPTEFEIPVSGKKLRLDLIPSGKTRKRLRKLVGKDKLKPVFRTDFMRTTQSLKSAQTEIELALDDGSTIAAGKTAAICQAELELKAGSVEELLKIARHLFAGIPFGFGLHSKAEHGYRLAEAGTQKPGAPVNAAMTELHRADSVAQAFSSICRSSTDQILGNWHGLRTGDDPEFAHQMRVGLRRLRTALRVFQPAVDTPATRALARSLARFGRRIGELRDADVLLADIARPVRPSSKSQDEPRKLEALLEKRAAGIRKDLRQELKRADWNGLLLQVSLLPYGAGWADATRSGGKACRYARTALEMSWKPVARRARRLNDLSIEERHMLRKDLKTLRYTLEFFVSVLPAAKSRKFIARLRKLQNSFGYLNDVALAQTLPRITVTTTRKNPHLRRTVDNVLAWHNRQADDAWQHTQKQWQQLKKQPKPWK